MSKYTTEFNRLAPPTFYQEIKYFWQAFENREALSEYLEKAVKGELRPKYNQLFERYDNGAAELMFVTNHRCKSIEELAAKEGNSLSQFLASAAAEKLAVMQTVDYLRQEAEKGRRDDFDRYLAAVPNAAPPDYD